MLEKLVHRNGVLPRNQHSTSDSLMLRACVRACEGVAVRLSSPRSDELYLLDCMPGPDEVPIPIACDPAQNPTAQPSLRGSDPPA